VAFLLSDGGKIMRARSLLAASLLAAAVLVVGAQPTRAGDTIRLNIAANNTPTLTLAGTPADADADTIDVRGGGGRGGGGGIRGGFYGGGRGGYGGYRGGFYGGYRGGYGGYGYRGFGYAGYRGYGYGWGGYRGWGGYGWGGWGGWGGLYTPYYYPYYYGSPIIYTSPVYYSPISTSSLTVTPPISLGIGANQPGGNSLNAVPPGFNPYDQQQPPMQGDPTFPYDGGPRLPVPMPKTNEVGAPPAPTGSPAPPRLPLEGRTVSLPAQQKPQFTYPAYGDKVRDTTPDRTTIVRLPR
jgi:hypothetical protein